jgi:hypothetical protein
MKREERTGLKDPPLRGAGVATETELVWTGEYEKAGLKLASKSGRGAKPLE